jgi:hypothetical protein
MVMLKMWTFLVVSALLSLNLYAEATPAELIKAATTRPWPGKNIPELPLLTDDLVSHVSRELAADPNVLKAYSGLDAKKGNLDWFASVSELERREAIWSVLSALCHPHSDVQVHALRSLTRLKRERALPFLLKYAESMAVNIDGSESATIHGVIHQELGKAIAAITGLEVKLRAGQDPEAIKAAAEHARKWLKERLPSHADFAALLGQPIESDVVQKFVLRYRLEKSQKFDSGGFRNEEMPFSVLYRENKISRVVIRISNAPARHSPCYTAALPHGLKAEDSPEDVIKRLGKPSSQPEQDYLIYDKLKMGVSFFRDTHIMAEIDLDSN